MLRTPSSAQNSKTTIPALSAPSGLRVIDPADFKFIAGGAPRGGWLEASSSAIDTTSTTDAVAAPRGGW